MPTLRADARQCRSEALATAQLDATGRQTYERLGRAPGRFEDYDIDVMLSSIGGRESQRFTHQEAQPSRHTPCLSCSHDSPKVGRRRHGANLVDMTAMGDAPSVPGRGTAFRFSLPVARIDQTQGPRASQATV
jgi:hypothetical protein